MFLKFTSPDIFIIFVIFVAVRTPTKLKMHTKITEDIACAL
jgi:hypothetical protein